MLRGRLRQPGVPASVQPERVPPDKSDRQMFAEAGQGTQAVQASTCDCHLSAECDPGPG